MVAERIKVLQDAGIIESAAAEFADRSESELRARYPERNDAIEVFVTHLAMATQRILNGEVVESIDQTIWKEVCDSGHCDMAEHLLQQILQQSPCQMPESEYQFLVIHLCNILNN